MKLDFSNPEEAPEEFRAVTFNAPPAKKGMRMPSLTALEIQTQGVLTPLALTLTLIHTPLSLLTITFTLSHAHSYPPC